MKNSVSRFDNELKSHCNIALSAFQSAIYRR